MTKLSVPGMSCGHCKSSIEKAVSEMDAAASVNVDLEGRTVSVDTSATDAALIDAIKTAGYDATVA